MAKATEDIISNMDDKFNVWCTDKGSEFTAKFKSVLDKYGVRHFLAGASTKCPTVERVIRNLRTRIARFTEYHNTERYIDSLADVVKSYNSTYHSAIKMSPDIGI